MAKSKVKPGQKPRVIYWFRTDLRLHDSPALKAALDLEPECLYPVWCWDPHYVYRARGGPNRWQILLDCLNDISSGLAKVNSKQKLLLIREGPVTLLPKLFEAWSISHLVFEKDTDAYAKDRDAKVKEAAEKAGVEVICPYGRTLWDSDEIVKANGGKPTMSFAQLEAVKQLHPDCIYLHAAIRLIQAQAGNKIGEVPRPIPAPKYLPDPGDTGFNFDQTAPESEPDWLSYERSHPDTSYEKLAGPKGDFAIPTMEELGLPKATTPHKGGETVGLASLDAVMKDEEYAATFEKPKTAPTAFEPADTTVLSHHLHFGSLSCREFYWRAQDIHDERKRNGKRSSGRPANLPGQLIFRDMYFGAHAALGPVFAQTIGNPNCRFIPWHLPTNVAGADGGSKTAGDASSADGLSPKAPAPEPEYSVDDADAERWFRRWRDGVTGFPFVDALMRQLRTEGWIHHLGRHMVACFLTRGGCYVDWQRGAAVFEEWLIDHEAACNVGNWQWLSCAAFCSRFHRCYSPVAFGKRWGEARGVEFIRRFVPELARLPDRFVFEPHKAPVRDQMEAGVRISGDGSKEEDGDLRLYPKPMFDFAARREVCMRRMKRAYGMRLYGDDARVLDGSWRDLFLDDAEGAIEGGSGRAGEMVEDDGGRGGLDLGHSEGVVGDGHGDRDEDEGQKGKRASRTPESVERTKGKKRGAGQVRLEDKNNMAKRSKAGSRR